MKIYFKNADVVFQKATAVEVTHTKTFSAGEVGGYGVITVPLSNPIKPNMKLNVLITGDAGVVVNNKWNFKLNGLDSPGIIVDRGVQAEMQYNGVISSIVLQRDSIAAAGTVIINLKYFDDSMYVPEVIGGDVQITSGVGSGTFNFDNTLAGPGFVWVNALLDGGANNNLKLSLYDGGGVLVSSRNFQSNTGDKPLYFPENVKSAKIEAASGSTASGNYAVTITH